MIPGDEKAAARKAVDRRSGTIHLTQLTMEIIPKTVSLFKASAPPKRPTASFRPPARFYP